MDAIIAFAKEILNCDSLLHELISLFISTASLGLNWETIRSQQLEIYCLSIV